MAAAGNILRNPFSYKRLRNYSQSRKTVPSPADLAGGSSSARLCLHSRFTIRNLQSAILRCPPTHYISAVNRPGRISIKHLPQSSYTRNTPGAPPAEKINKNRPHPSGGAMAVPTYVGVRRHESAPGPANPQSAFRNPKCPWRFHLPQASAEVNVTSRRPTPAAGIGRRPRRHKIGVARTPQQRTRPRPPREAGPGADPLPARRHPAGAAGPQEAKKFLPPFLPAPPCAAHRPPKETQAEEQ